MPYNTYNNYYQDNQYNQYNLTSQKYNQKSQVPANKIRNNNNYKYNSLKYDHKFDQDLEINHEKYFNNTFNGLDTNLNIKSSNENYNFRLPSYETNFSFNSDNNMNVNINSGNKNKAQEIQERFDKLQNKLNYLQNMLSNSGPTVDLNNNNDFNIIHKKDYIYNNYNNKINNINNNIQNNIYKSNTYTSNYYNNRNNRKGNFMRKNNNFRNNINNNNFILKDLNQIHTNMQNKNPRASLIKKITKAHLNDNFNDFNNNKIINNNNNINNIRNNKITKVSPNNNIINNQKNNFNYNIRNNKSNNLNFGKINNKSNQMNRYINQNNYNNNFDINKYPHEVDQIQNNNYIKEINPQNYNIYSKPKNTFLPQENKQINQFNKTNKSKINNLENQNYNNNKNENDNNDSSSENLSDLADDLFSAFNQNSKEENSKEINFNKDVTEFNLEKNNDVSPNMNFGKSNIIKNSLISKEEELINDINLVNDDNLGNIYIEKTDQQKNNNFENQNKNNIRETQDFLKENIMKQLNFINNKEGININNSYIWINNNNTNNNSNNNNNNINNNSIPNSKINNINYQQNQISNSNIIVNVSYSKDGQISKEEKSLEKKESNEKPKHKGHIKINIDNNLYYLYKIQSSLEDYYEIHNNKDEIINTKKELMNLDDYMKMLKENISPNPCIKYFDEKSIKKDLNYVYKEDLTEREIIPDLFDDDEDDIKSLRQSLEKSIDKVFTQSFNKDIIDLEVNDSNISETMNESNNAGKNIIKQLKNIGGMENINEVNEEEKGESFNDEEDLEQEQEQEEKSDYNYDEE